MIRYPEKIVNFSAFVDGISYAGLITSGSLPGIKLMTALHRGGGMDGSAPVDMGMEDMEATLVAQGWNDDLVTLIGTTKSLVLRPARKTEMPGEEAIVVTLSGLWTSTEFGELSPGKDVPLTLKCACSGFQYEKGGKSLIKIDTKKAIRQIGEVDQLADLRRQMGL